MTKPIVSDEQIKQLLDEAMKKPGVRDVLEFQQMIAPITPHGMDGEQIVRFLAELNKTLELLVKACPLVPCTEWDLAYGSVLDAISTLCTFRMQLEVKENP